VQETGLRRLYGMPYADLGLPNGLATTEHQLDIIMHLVDISLLELGQRRLKVKVLRRHGNRHRRGRPGRPCAAWHAVRLLLRRWLPAPAPCGAPAAAAADKPWRAASSSSAAPAAPAAATAGTAVAPASPPALRATCENAAPIGTC